MRKENKSCFDRGHKYCDALRPHRISRVLLKRVCQKHLVLADTRPCRNVSCNLGETWSIPEGLKTSCKAREPLLLNEFKQQGPLSDALRRYILQLWLCTRRGRSGCRVRSPRQRHLALARKRHCSRSAQGPSQSSPARQWPAGFFFVQSGFGPVPSLPDRLKFFREVVGFSRLQHVLGLEEC